MKKIETPQDLENLRRSLRKGRDLSKPCIAICSGTGCRACGCEKVIDAFKEEINKQRLNAKVDIRTTGCHGFCERGPLVVIHPEKIFYQQVKPDDVPEIVYETVMRNNIIDRLLYKDPRTGKKIEYEDEIPFYKKQKRLIFGNNGKIDPTSISDYILLGGYSSLSKVLFSMSPEEIIEEITKAGLRGRGGGGFLTGRKWHYCRKAPGDIKYVICNADEGDPGAYMDRSLLEGNPHSVLEGMSIGAYAIGAEEGYIYVRNEYPLAVNNVKVALRQAAEYGFLGENILGSGFNFTIQINRGGGAFVCGESTALVASLEGRVGEPRAKHIHTVESGLWERPTNLNNVETWANVPLIMAKGADWYSKIGTKESKGTKIFSLVGKIKNTGLVEVPMGITLREIIYDIGGGIPQGKKFKAIQTGGPSGGCIPEKLIDLPIDFEELTRVGSMMGSGGMIVMDEGTCMVDIAKYFLSFLQDESCGKCTSCREGIKRMLQILTRITQGKGEEGDIELLEELSQVVADTSLCALGATAPNPVLTTIRYFRQEYEAHIKDKKCPAKVCKDLITYTIDREKCRGCLVCKKLCPQQAIEGKRKEPHRIDQAKCIKCGICLENCKFGAIVVS